MITLKTILLFFIMGRIIDAKYNQNILPIPTPTPAPVVEIRKETKASWYCQGFEGNKTANGETYDCQAFTTACNFLPFGTLVRITNVSNQKSVVVRVNDRGGFEKYGRGFDLSREAFEAISPLSKGVIIINWEIAEEK